MLFLAPIHGYTDYYFRNAFHKHFGGIDVAITPFVPLVTGRKVNLNHIRDLWPENNNAMPIIPQVIGNDPTQFVMMADQLYNMGYESLNWNLGCPMRYIARKKRGSGLLPHPEIIQRTMESVLPRIKNKFSVKVRLGYESEDEIDKLIPVLNSFDLEFVAIHPRIGLQMYGGSVNLGKFSYCMKELKHTIIYNGDINNPRDLYCLKQDFPGVQSWMLGRGVLRNLFLPIEIKKGECISAQRKLSMFKDFQEELFTEIPRRIVKEKSYVNKLKEYWGNFNEMFENGDQMLQRIRQAKSAGEIENSIRELLSQFVVFKT